MNLVKKIGIVFSIICTLLALLYFSTYISNDSIQKNISKSADILCDQGYGFAKKSLGRVIFIHNHTDALMLNIIYSTNPDKKLESILINKRNYNPKVKAPLIKEYNGNLIPVGDTYDLPSELFKTVNNEKLPVIEYMKYWHGYIIILKPLLLFLDITGIRILITFIILTSLLFLCYLIYKEIDWKTSLAVFISFMSVNLITTALFNIQGMFVFIIALISSIIVFKKDLSDDNFYLLLIINGILTAFFDFLTTPIIVVLIPLIIKNLKNPMKASRKQILLYFSKCLICFFASYGLFWFSKWLIVDLIYHRDLIKICIDETLYRTGIKYPDQAFIRAIPINFMLAANIITVPIFILYLVYAEKIYYKENMIYSLSILTILLWFLATSQHVDQHCFFTYRNIVVVSLAMTLTSLSKKHHKKRKKKNND